MKKLIEYIRNLFTKKDESNFILTPSKDGSTEIHMKVENKYVEKLCTIYLFNIPELKESSGFLSMQKDMYDYVKSMEEFNEMIVDILDEILFKEIITKSYKHLNLPHFSFSSTEVKTFQNEKVLVFEKFLSKKSKQEFIEIFNKIV